MFGWKMGFDQIFLVDGDEGEENAGDADGCKDGSSLFGVEVVGRLENQRNRSQCHVEDSPAKAYPQAEECHDWFGYCVTVSLRWRWSGYDSHTKHVERSVKTDPDHCQDTASFFVGFDFPPDSLGDSFLRLERRRHRNSIVACFFEAFVPFVQSFGFAREQDGASSFLEEQYDEHNLSK